MAKTSWLIGTITCAALLLVGSVQAEDWTFGFAKRDVTPTKPMRLSGYSSRTQPYEGIDESLWTRAMAFRDADEKQAVLVSVDTIGFPGALTDDIAKTVEQRFDVPRARFVLCCTHSHTAPHVATGLTNIFSTPLSEAEAANANDYVKVLKTQVLAAVGEAIKNCQPGTLSFAEGTVKFARNRRVLKNGTWTGFGENPNGPVDHALPILVIKNRKGEVEGIVFNYACHCTTFGGQYNRVNGDWAGYAARDLEERYSGAVALCCIGCGADANPNRDPNQALENSKAQGRMIAIEVQRLVENKLSPLTSPFSAVYQPVELPFNNPTEAELKQRLTSNSLPTKRHAENMLALIEKNGQLPNSYPAPVHVWQFGNQLAMVFLGGEVVVDYALRLKKEIKSDHVWITAYANDVFAYVASERLRTEGGYEVDFSMIFYNQPGPWAKGTEDQLITHVLQLMKQGQAK